MKRLCFFVILLTIACNDPLSNNCDEETLCTEVFVSARAEIKHQNGEYVVLDSVQTSLENGMVIFTQLAEHRSMYDHSFGIVTDNEMDYLEFEGTNLTFKGFRNGEELFSEPYTIGKDCCHIKVIEGNFELIL